MALRDLTVVGLALVCLSACDADPSAPARFACTQPNEAPLPDGRGGHRCLRVGARENARAELWPSLDGVAAPRVFVRPDAPDGGDGSQARPVRDFAAALALHPATVVLSRGDHPVSAPVALTEALTVVGADPATAVLVLSPGAGVSTSAALTLRTVGFRSASTLDEAAVGATAGATLTLDDVSIEGGPTGVRVESATLFASHLTVRRTARRDVDLSGDSRAVIRSALLRDGAGSGLSIDRARVYFAEGLVAAHARKGVVLQGQGDATRGFSDCLSDPATAAAGANDCLTEVAVIGSGLVALSVEGPRALEARRMTLAETRAIDGTGSADGLFVSRGGEVTIDPEIALDAQQGFGTEVVDNARFGVLVDGGELIASPSRLSLRGAALRRNAHGGVFLQNRAVATRVAFARFEENGGVGLAAVPTATITEIGCNGFLRTRPATLAGVTEGGSPVTLTLADGISLSGARDVQIVANRFTDNARFAAVFLGASGRVDANDGAGNRYPLGVYGSPSLVVTDTNRVTGTEAAPPTLPGIADATR